MSTQRLPSTTSTEIQQMYTDSEHASSRYQNLRKHLPLPNNPVSIKCKCGTEVRRVTVHTVPTYDELLLLVHRLFRNMLSNNLNNLVLKYIDEDHDLVSVTDDLDINHAIAVSPNLKLLIFDKETRPFSDHVPRAAPEKVSAMETISLRQEFLHLSSRVERLLVLVEKMTAGDKSSAITKPLSSTDLDEFVGKPGDQKGTVTPATPAETPKPTNYLPPSHYPPAPTNTSYPPSRYQHHPQQYNAPPANSQPPQQQYSYTPTQPAPSQYPPSATPYPHHMPQGSSTPYPAPHAPAYPSSMGQNAHSSYYPSAPGAQQYH